MDFISKLIPLACALVLPAFAQVPVTLQEAVDYALHHHPELTAGTQQHLAARARAEAAEAARLPELTGRYTARASNNALDALADKLNTQSVTASDFEPARLNQPGTNTLHVLELGVQVPVYTAGRLPAEIRQARRLEDAAALQYRRQRAAIAAQTMSAYLEAQAAEQAAAIAREAVESARQHANSTTRLVKERRAPAADRLTAHVNLAAFEGRLEQALARTRQAQQQLKLVMGAPLDQAIALQPGLSAVGVAAGARSEGEQRAQQRADLQAMRARLDAARARVGAARAADKAQFTVRAGTAWYERDHPAFDNNAWNVMGVVSKNIYSGGRNQRLMEAARHEAEALEGELRALERTVLNEVHQAHIDLAEARARLTIAEKNVENARAAVAQVKTRYGQGRTLLIDLLQSERALVDARNEELSARLRVLLSQVAASLAEGSVLEGAE